MTYRTWYAALRARREECVELATYLIISFVFQQVIEVKEKPRREDPYYSKVLLKVCCCYAPGRKS